MGRWLIKICLYNHLMIICICYITRSKTCPDTVFIPAVRPLNTKSCLIRSCIGVKCVKWSCIYIYFLYISYMTVVFKWLQTVKWLDVSWPTHPFSNNDLKQPSDVGMNLGQTSKGLERWTLLRCFLGQFILLLGSYTACTHMFHMFGQYLSS